MALSNSPDFSLFDHIPLGIFIVDKDFNIVFWNQYLEDWSGLQKSEVLKKNLFEKYPRLNNVKYKGRLKSVMNGGAPATFTSLLHKYIIPIELKDGTLANQNVIAKYLQGQNRKHPHILFVIQNTTDIDKRNRQIKELQETSMQILKTSNEALEEFSLLISHGLKAPLRGIHFYADQVLETEGLNQETHSRLDEISSIAKKMTSMISSLLSYSRVGQMNYGLEECSINEITDELSFMFKPIFEETNTKFLVNGPLPTIQGDKLRITKLFHNLLENALKYNDKADKVIELGYQDSKQGPVFFVADNGIGIKEDQQENIFKMFSQVDKKKEGVGAGLALVRKIVERHGGQIWVESKLGEGTKFLFTLGSEEAA